MRNRFVFVALIAGALVACEDDVLPPKPPAVAAKARVTAPASAGVIMTRVDTTKASSICKASVRARTRARAQLDQTPGDPMVRRKATDFDALVSDACR